MAARNPGGEKHVKGGTTAKAREFELCVALPTQHMIGLCQERWQRVVNIRHTYDILQESLSCFPTMESFGNGANRSVGIALRKPWCSCDSVRLCPGVSVHRGNNHCTPFFYEPLFSCWTLFGLLYRFLWTGTRGQNPLSTGFEKI